jgi:ABC-type dipeptide/oligopeptide/nickel transport system permease component
MFRKNKKGMQGVVNVISAVPVIAILAVVMTVVISFGGTILTKFSATQTANQADYNITSYSLAGLGTFGSFLPVIWLVIAIVVIVGLLFAILPSVGLGKQ